MPFFLSCLSTLYYCGFARNYFAMYAQFKVQATFQHYLQVRAQNGMTGADVARLL